MRPLARLHPRWRAPSHATRNDVALLRQAFLPEAKLWFVGQSGKLGHLTQQDWYRSVSANAGRTERVNARIVAVDITNDVAMVKVVEEWPAERYTDYLSLVRAAGGWKIVDKVFTTERR